MNNKPEQVKKRDEYQAAAISYNGANIFCSLSWTIIPNRPSVFSWYRQYGPLQDACHRLCKTL